MQMQTTNKRTLVWDPTRAAAARRERNRSPLQLNVASAPAANRQWTPVEAPPRTCAS